MLVNMTNKACFFTIGFFVLTALGTEAFAQQKKNGPKGLPVQQWRTTADQSALLQHQPGQLFFKAQKNDLPVITINRNQTFQSIDGFGFTLTGGSADLLNNLPQAKKTALLQELFGHNANSIGISYLRISIAASDLNATVFSYDDLPAGETDVPLEKFNLSQDTLQLIPLLKEILRINPKIKILATPWSPPVWMKDNHNTMGGHLLPEYYDTYARYFTRYISAMKKKGITIDAITPQNEPLNDGNNPSLVMTAEEQNVFIRDHLGLAFRQAGIKTKIILYDHNCDRPDYPLTILKDSATRKFIDGSAFHLYGGDISNITPIHDQFPDKNLYFTEQWTGANDGFDGSFAWHIKNVVIGSMRNWCKIALEWNLANDPNFGPHTPGGCTECKGALTIGDTVTRNIAYYIIAHAAKFVPPGSIRIGSDVPNLLANVAFLTPSGKTVLLVLNEGKTTVEFNIKDKGNIVTTSLPAGAVATYIW